MKTVKFRFILIGFFTVISLIEAINEILSSKEIDFRYFRWYERVVETFSKDKKMVIGVARAVNKNKKWSKISVETLKDSSKVPASVLVNHNYALALTMTKDYTNPHNIYIAIYLKTIAFIHAVNFTNCAIFSNLKNIKTPFCKELALNLLTFCDGGIRELSEAPDYIHLLNIWNLTEYSGKPGVDFSGLLAKQTESTNRFISGVEYFIIKYKPVLNKIEDSSLEDISTHQAIDNFLILTAEDDKIYNELKTEQKKIISEYHINVKLIDAELKKLGREARNIYPIGDIIPELSIATTIWREAVQIHEKASTGGDFNFMTVLRECEIHNFVKRGLINEEGVKILREVEKADYRLDTKSKGMVIRAQPFDRNSFNFLHK